MQAAFDNGEWSISLEDEDAHTAIENQLISRIGETGGRVHLGRSRNDQVLTAIRLYLKDAVDQLESSGGQLVDALDDLREMQGDIVLP